MASEDGIIFASLQNWMDSIDIFSEKKISTGCIILDTEADASLYKFVFISECKTTL